MRYLSFDLSEGDDGVTTLEAMASTDAAQHPAVLAEAQQVLDWAWQAFAHSHGPVDEGGDWDHDAVRAEIVQQVRETIGAVAALTDDREVVGGFDDHAQPGPHQRVVVDDDDAGHGASLGS